MSSLQNYFAGLAQQGMTLLPADAEERKKRNADIRKQFDTCLYEAQTFLGEEALFIPKHICVVAESATRAANMEQYNFAAFGPYAESELPLTGSEDRKALVEMRQQYNKAKAESFKTFNEAMEQLDKLMREHIAGKVDSTISS